MFFLLLVLCYVKFAETKLVKEAIQRWKHDINCFSQGIALHDDPSKAHLLYESCGAMQGSSSIREMDLRSGKTTKTLEIGGGYFTEDITIHKGVLYALTYENETLLAFNVNNDMQLLGTKRYEGEGWGLTHDGTSLIHSNGTNILKYYDIPYDFSTTSENALKKRTEVEVYDSLTVGHPHFKVNGINALAFVNGFVYANLWVRDFIMKISPTSGVVVDHFDVAPLRPDNVEIDVCANGVVYDSLQKRFIVTGVFCSVWCSVVWVCVIYIVCVDLSLHSQPTIHNHRFREYSVGYMEYSVGYREYSVGYREYSVG